MTRHKRCKPRYVMMPWPELSAAYEAKVDRLAQETRCEVEDVLRFALRLGLVIEELVEIYNRIGRVQSPPWPHVSPIAQHTAEEVRGVVEVLRQFVDQTLPLAPKVRRRIRPFQQQACMLLQEYDSLIEQGPAPQLRAEQWGRRGD